MLEGLVVAPRRYGIERFLRVVAICKRYMGCEKGENLSEVSRIQRVAPLVSKDAEDSDASALKLVKMEPASPPSLKSVKKESEASHIITYSHVEMYF